MASKRDKSPASQMASLRWAKTTKEERSAHAKKMVTARETWRRLEKQAEASAITSDAELPANFGRIESYISAARKARAIINGADTKLDSGDEAPPPNHADVTDKEPNGS